MKQIKIRCLNLDPLDRPIPPLTFFVEHESEAAIHISNRVKGPLHTEVTLVKVSEKILENSAGCRFEIV